MLSAAVRLVMLVLGVASAANAQVVHMSQQQHKTQHNDQLRDLLFAVSERKNQQMDMFRTQKIVCPNGVTQCPDSTTCCPLKNGQYGCCSGANAVCCKDGVHCCPKGYRCDEQHGQCVSDSVGVSFHWTDKKPVRAQPVVSVTANITCPDKKTICQLNDTCCNATTGYGCCPLFHAVCCIDKRHCCPVGTKCDVARRRCFREATNWEQPWVEKHSGNPETSGEITETPTEILVKSDAVICKDGQMCMDGQTCCLMSNGSYGCCQYADAVCCSDHVHCCPEGCVCDYEKQQCTGKWAHKWSRIKRPRLMATQAEQADAVSRTTELQDGSVMCPGGGQSCPAGETCCPISDQYHGCCPISKAVCCSDRVHCCPDGTVCNVREHRCDSDTTSYPMMKKVPAGPSNP